MGLWSSKMSEWVWNKFEDDPPRFLMLGLDNAGKTTLLYKLKHNVAVNIIQTLTFNIETIKIGSGVTFTVWDVGGEEVLRNFWHHYYHGSAGLLFVVDSSDRMQLQRAREEMMRVLNADEMRGVPVVVMANKQDLPGACSTAELTDALGLNNLCDHNWHIQSTSAVNGDGIYESMFEMARMAKVFKKNRGS